jgi:hypothetical protein
MRLPDVVAEGMSVASSPWLFMILGLAMAVADGARVYLRHRGAG